MMMSLHLIVRGATVDGGGGGGVGVLLWRPGLAGGSGRTSADRRAVWAYLIWLRGRSRPLAAGRGSWYLRNLAERVGELCACQLWGSSGCHMFTACCLFFLGGGSGGGFGWILVLDFFFFGFLALFWLAWVCVCVCVCAPEIFSTILCGGASCGIGPWFSAGAVVLQSQDGQGGSVGEGNFFFFFFICSPGRVLLVSSGLVRCWIAAARAARGTLKRPGRWRGQPGGHQTRCRAEQGGRPQD